VETESEFRKWSNASNWPNNTLPKEGDYVEIKSGWKMILDVKETPVFTMVTVNGLLYFSDEMDVHLQAFHILVRAGELHIGNETRPHPKNALITLHGLKTEDFNQYPNSVELGNKVLANVGLVKMFGQKRAQKMTRLTAEAF